MRRRDFIALVSNGVAAWPLGALAQEPGKTWRMGFIAQGYEKFYDALFDGLRDFGYTEGRNLIVERRYAEGRAERFQEFATEMVRLKVDIIIVSTTPAAIATKSAHCRGAPHRRILKPNRNRPHREATHDWRDRQ
jgi:putative ABC transport system substrate-binding protein